MAGIATTWLRMLLRVADLPEPVGAEQEQVGVHHLFSVERIKVMVPPPRLKKVMPGCPVPWRPQSGERLDVLGEHQLGVPLATVPGRVEHAGQPTQVTVEGDFIPSRTGCRPALSMTLASCSPRASRFRQIASA